MGLWMEPLLPLNWAGKESGPFGEASPGVGAEDSCQPLGGSGPTSGPFPLGIGSAWWQIPGGTSVFVVCAIL